MLLKFLLNDEGFNCVDAPKASNAVTINYLKCHFDIQRIGWHNVDAITAIFKSSTYNKVAEVMLDSNNDCFIEPEIYERGGNIQCKLVGEWYRDGHIYSTSHVTEVAEFYVKENIIIPTPIPSKYEIFLAEFATSKQSLEELVAEINARLEAGEFDGADGQGVTSIIYNSDGTVTLVLADGSSFTSEFSLKGQKGDKGDIGVGIASVVYGEDGTVVITLTDGNRFTSTYSMKGEKGDRGEQGIQGERGVPGVDNYILGFNIDSTTGCLMMEYATAPGIDFSLSNGDLIMEVQ